MCWQTDKKSPAFHSTAASHQPAALCCPAWAGAGAPPWDALSIPSIQASHPPSRTLTARMPGKHGPGIVQDVLAAPALPSPTGSPPSPVCSGSTTTIWPGCWRASFLGSTLLHPGHPGLAGGVSSILQE